MIHCSIISSALLHSLSSPEFQGEPNQTVKDFNCKIVERGSDEISLYKSVQWNLAGNSENYTSGIGRKGSQRQSTEYVTLYLYLFFTETIKPANGRAALANVYDLYLKLVVKRWKPSVRTLASPPRNNGQYCKYQRLGFLNFFVRHPVTVDSYFLIFYDDKVGHHKGYSFLESILV